MSPEETQRILQLKVDTMTRSIKALQNKTKSLEEELGESNEYALQREKELKHVRAACLGLVKQLVELGKGNELLTSPDSTTRKLAREVWAEKREIHDAENSTES